MPMIARPAMAALAACTVLAACGENVGTPARPGFAPSLDQISGYARSRSAAGGSGAFENGVAQIWGDIANAADAPVPDDAALAGTLTYRGAVVLETPSLAGGNDFFDDDFFDDDLPRSVGALVSATGGMRMNVDFQTGQVSGSISGLNIGGEELLGGDLSVSGNVVNRHGIRANISGSMTSIDTQARFSGLMNGEFRGAGADVAAGGIELFGRFRAFENESPIGDEFGRAFSGGFHVTRQ